MLGNLPWPSVIWVIDGLGTHLFLMNLQMNNTHVAMAEAVGTMVLCFTVLMVATTKSQTGNEFFGVAIR